jgi:hypothetical protein
VSRRHLECRKPLLQWLDLKGNRLLPARGSLFLGAPKGKIQSKIILKNFLNFSEIAIDSLKTFI